jgi:hypothetical protein
MLCNDFGLRRRQRQGLRRWGFLALLGVGLFFVLSPARSRGQILTLTPSLSLGERYDDNIFQDQTDKVDDFVTSVTPGVALRYTPSLATELDLDYQATFEFFAENASQNQTTQRGTLDFTAPLLSFLSIELSDWLLLTQEPADREIPIEDVSGLRPASEQRRDRTLRNQADIAFDIRLLSRWALGVSSGVFIHNVGVPDELDELHYSVGAALGYITDIARDSRLSVGYDVTFFTFSENPPGDPNLEAADFETHSLVARFRHSLSPTLSGEVAVGYALVTSDDPTFDGKTSPVASLRIIKALRDGRAVLRYGRYFRSGGGQGGVVTADTLALTFSAPLFPKIVARLGGNLSFFNFAQKATQTNGGDRLLVAVRSGLTYQPLYFLSFSVDYAFKYVDYTGNDSGPTFANYSDQRFIVTSRLTLRAGWFLSLTYDYITRYLKNGIAPAGVDPFDRNRVTLALTYAPTFRVFR